MQTIRIFVRVGPAGHDSSRALVAGCTDGRDNRGVIVARGVAEPVRGNAVALLDHVPRYRNLIVQRLGIERDQIGMAETLRIELPPGGHQAADLPLAESAL